MGCGTSKSWKLYKTGLRYLACGSSTSSKTPAFENIEPALIVKGKGCRVWDADGNEYIDFRNGLGPVSLGYSIPSVNSAIKRQLKNGIIFGHPHPFESEVAQLLVENIPCAQQVRFLKTGGEAIAACIKIARAATKRNKIIQCGYNGWLNVLSSGGTLPSGIANSQPLKGIPEQISCLHLSLPWADITEWEKVFAKEGQEIAATVIACDYKLMEEGKTFLPAIRALTQKYGIIMVMDEIVTGFRLAIGGAHQYFGFLPDMAVFGKAMANGMPISAYVGKEKLMESARTIGISSTFGGETLSLAAEKATIEFYKRKNVIRHLWTKGKLLQDGINLLFQKYNFPAELKGFPVCPKFIFNNTQNRQLFFQGCYSKGVSLYDTPYVTFAHKKADIHESLNNIQSALKQISDRAYK